MTASTRSPPTLEGGTAMACYGSKARIEDLLQYCFAMSVRKTRIMYIENKSEALNGPARIGRVTLSKSGQSLRYGEKEFQRLGGRGFKANYFDADTGEHYWISGPRKDGADRLYPGSTMPVEIDADVAEEYWRDIRALPTRE